MPIDYDFIPFRHISYTLINHMYKLTSIIFILYLSLFQARRLQYYWKCWGLTYTDKIRLKYICSWRISTFFSGLSSSTIDLNASLVYLNKTGLYNVSRFLGSWINFSFLYLLLSWRSWFLIFLLWKRNDICGISYIFFPSTILLGIEF